MDHSFNPKNSAEIYTKSTSTDFGGEPEARCGQSGWCTRGGSLGPYCTSEGKQTSAVFLSPNKWHTKQWNKEFTSLDKQIQSLIKYKTPKSNVYGKIKRMANVLKTTYSRLKRIDDKPLEMTNPPKKTAELQTPPSIATGTLPCREDFPRAMEAGKTRAFAQEQQAAG